MAAVAHESKPPRARRLQPQQARAPARGCWRQASPERTRGLARKRRPPRSEAPHMRRGERQKGAGNAGKCAKQRTRAGKGGKKSLFLRLLAGYKTSGVLGPSSVPLNTQLLLRTLDSPQRHGIVVHRVDVQHVACDTRTHARRGASCGAYRPARQNLHQTQHLSLAQAKISSENAGACARDVNSPLAR